MRNVLLIAYAFPPIPYAGTYRSLRLCKKIDGKAIKIHVLTIKVYKDIPNDFNLLKNIPVEVDIHRTAICDPWRKHQSWIGKINKLPGSRYINKIITFLLRPLTIPDHMVLWIVNAVPAAMKIIRKHNIDTVVVTSPPTSTLFVGYVLKKLSRIKWIADLRDPIVGNVYEVELNQASDIATRIKRYIRIKLRKIVAGNADMIVTTTETHRDKLISDYNIKPDMVSNIYNSFDEDDFNSPQEVKFDAFTISHMGSLGGLRRIDVLFKAIKMLEQDIGPDGLKLQLLFYGMHDPYLGKDIVRYEVDRYCRVRDIVPNYQAIEIIRASHLLLLLKATGPGALDHIPAKLFEYIGARRTILCIGSEKSEAAMIINRHKLGYTVEDDVDRIYQILKEEYSQYMIGVNRKIESNDVMKFSSEGMARKYTDTISYVNTE